MSEDLKFFRSLLIIIAIGFVVWLGWNYYLNYDASRLRFPIAQVTATNNWQWTQKESNHLMRLMGIAPRTLRQNNKIEWEERPNILTCISYVFDEKTPASAVFVAFGLQPDYSRSCTPQLFVYVKVYPGDAESTERELVRATRVGMQLFAYQIFGWYEVDKVIQASPDLALADAEAKVIAQQMGPKFPAAFSPYSYRRQTTWGGVIGVLGFLMIFVIDSVWFSGRLLKKILSNSGFGLARILQRFLNKLNGTHYNVSSSKPPQPPAKQVPQTPPVVVSQSTKKP